MSASILVVDDEDLATLPARLSFPVPGYADAAALSGPLASSSRRAGVAHAGTLAPRDGHPGLGRDGPSSYIRAQRQFAVR